MPLILRRNRWVYQQLIGSDSASIEGMEEVFEEKAPAIHGDQNAQSSETMPASMFKAGNRVLRGTYDQGLLLLREEVLRPLAIDPKAASSQNRHPDRILYSRNRPGEPIRSFETEFGKGEEASHSAGFAETSAEILELVRQHAEQAKVANELIKRLTEQLKKQSQYIERLRSGEPIPNIWERLWQWIRGRFYMR